jgi:hypothetical protein
LENGFSSIMANVVVGPTTFALLLVVALIHAAPTHHHHHAVGAADKCRTGCQGVTPNVFKYAEGTTYKYNLESNVDITLSSAEGQQSATKLKATVLLTQQAQCVQILRLQNVQVFGGDGKKRGTIPNVEKPIKLNFHDGHLEDVICTEHGDTQVSLNIKRAVASLFQAALKHDSETDIFGQCPTDITSHKDGNNQVITKNRILNRCAYREHAKHDFMTTAFNIHSEIKSSPILKSDYNSEMRLKDGILDHVLLTENYLYLPFSVGKNGAKATVQTKLQFTGKNKEAPKVKCTEPKSILFENPHPIVSDKSDVKTILDAVKDTANSIKETVSEHTAKKFGNLITVMSNGKKDHLLSVYNQVQAGAGFADKEKAKKVFLDALFRAGTGDCLEVSIQLLKSKQLSPLEEKMVYLGMSFIRHGTPDAISTAASLLDNPKLPREAYLGIGALTAHYCKAHDCHDMEQIKLLSGKLLAKLKDGKPANREVENEMIAVLKALTNMKHLADSVVPKVISIAQDKKNSLRLRVAALEAYESDACKDKLRDSATAILKDIQQDSEVRIKAYLALAECPNGKVAAAIKNVLDNEPSYQVGGFIVSHIRNLRASANPDKELAKKELANVNTMKSFPIDPRKYSFNNEFSYAINTLGASSSVESNVIYSQNSFLPRSTSLNLTTEIFGHKINLLEIDTRQENLDKLMEHYLGPLGVLRNKNPDELMKSGKASFEKIMEHLEARMKKTRGKRHVPKNEIDAIGKAVQIKSNDLNNDLDLDMSLKIFGSEFLFLTLNENAEKYTAESIIDKVFDYLDSGIDKAKNFHHTFTRNGVFIDAELAYPTSSGFPLKLSVEGTDSIQLIADSKMDIRAMLQGAKQSVMELKLIPSANIEISGRLTLDASIMESGLKVLSNLHTATGGALVLEVFPTGIDAKFNLPIEKQEIINAQHQLLFFSRDSGHSEVETPMKFIESKPLDICFDTISQIVGLTVCAALNSPNQQLNQATFLPYPLNGNSELRLFITRDEMVTYHLRDVLYHDEKRGFEFVIETLDQNKKPKVSFNVEGFIHPDKYIKVSLDSPIKKAVIEGRLVDTDSEKSIGAKFVHDVHEYSGKLGISVSGNAAKSTYKPMIEFSTPEQGKQSSPYTMDGAIVVEKSGDNCKYTFDKVVLKSPSMAPISITGSMGRENGEFFADIQVGDGTNSGSIKGKLQASPNLIKIDAKVQNTISPVSNFHLDYQLSRDESTLNNDLTLVHGGDLNNKQNTLKIKNSITRKYTDPNNYQFTTKNSMSYPLLGVEGKLNINKVPKNLDYTIEGKYQKYKIGAKMNAKYNQKTMGDYDINLDAEALENKLKAKAKREINGDVSTIDNSLEINGKKAEVKGTVTHKCKPYDTDIGCDLTIQVPQSPDVIAIKHGFTHVPEEVKTHLKLSKGADQLVDFDLTAHKTNGGNGHIKADIKDILKLDGELKADKWNGKSHLIIELVKVQRKIKLDSTFEIAKPKFNIAANVYPNFEKSPQKISLVSNNELTKNSVDSKNKLDLFDNAFEANIKATAEGTPLEGKCTGEVDLTLPGGQYFAGKLNRELHSTNGLYNGKVFLNLEQRNNKNAPGRKLTLKGEAKNTNLKERKVDLTYNLAADDSNGKNINGDLSIKYDKTDMYNADIAGKLYGSVLSEPMELHHKASYKDRVGTYSLVHKCPYATVNLDGKYDLKGEGNPLSGSMNLNIGTKNAQVKTIKFSGSGKVLKDHDKLEVEGATKLFVDDDGTNPDATVDFSAEGDVKLGHHTGQLKGTTKIQKMDPITVAVGYGHTEENGVMKCQADASLKIAEGKTIKADASLIRPNPNEGKFELKLETPYEGAKKSDIELNYKKSEDFKQFSSDLTATVDGKKYVAGSEVKISEGERMVKFELTHDDHTDKFYVKMIQPGNHVYKGEVEMTRRDFTYVSSYDYNIPSVDDFTIFYKVDSPKLNLNKIEVQMKNNKNKVIEVMATSNGENLLKGSMNYKARDEGNKYIVEGSGEFTVKNEKKTGNFKYIRQTLTMDKNQEQGIEVSLDAALGNSAIDSEFKLTNKHFRILKSYCEKKNQCSHFEIDTKTHMKDISEYENEAEVTIELASYSFGMKAVTKRKLLDIDHTTDIHFQTNDNKKYQYSFYVHPKKAGMTLTTPKREVSLEGQLDIPPKFKGPAKFEIALYLDKKAEPTKKTAVSGTVEYTGNDKTGKYSAETKLTSPGLAKDMVLSLQSKYDVPNKNVEWTSTIDIFAKQNSKIVTTCKTQGSAGENNKYTIDSHCTMKSVGMGIEINYEEIFLHYDSKAHSVKFLEKLDFNIDNHKCTCLALLEADPTRVHAKVQLHNKELLNLESKLQLSKEQQIIDTDLKILGVKPIASHYEFKNYNTMKYSVGPKGDASKTINVNAAFIPGQIADFRADIANNDLVKASIQLDEANFLKPDYALNFDNMQKLVFEPTKKELDGALKEGKTALEDLAKSGQSMLKHVGEAAKKAAPNMNGVKDYYGGEWQKLVKEIEADPNIQKASEYLQKIFGALAKIVNEVVHKAVELIEQVCNMLKSIIEKFANTWDKEIMPQIRKVAENLYDAVHKILNSISDIVFALISKISAFLDAHQAEFKQLATSISSISQDLGRFITKNYERIRALITENMKKLYEEIKALPIYEELKTRYEMVLKDFGGLADPIQHIIDDSLNTLKDIVPNEDLKKIIDEIRDYIGKKFKQEAVDDVAAIEHIIRNIITMLKKLVKQYRPHDMQHLVNADNLSTNYFAALPRIVAAKFSPLSYLLQREGPWDSMKETMYGMSFNPRSWIGPPFRMYGYAVQGQHIFTFDGKHLTFPGSCNYLLARDAVNGNFTIGGTYSNGLLTAITYADATESVTIKKGGQIMHNKAATEFPLRVGQIEAFRSYQKMFIFSKAGVEISCDPNMVVCKFEVNGFYHGQLRGLLGNGNNEPYDDYTAANGKIVLSESDFGNSYKMTASCKPVQADDHSGHQRAPACTELFTNNNNLRICYPFVNPELYRTACDHGVAAGVKDTEMATALGYVTACNAKFIAAILPDKFMKCTNGDQEHSLGEKFSVKLPGKAADIVIIVDQDKTNEAVYKELVQPFVTEVTKELSAKGVTDVEFHLIGYGGEYQKWPSHFTNAGKLSWKGKLPTIKFTEAPAEEDCKTGSARLDTLIQVLKKAKEEITLVLGLDIRARTFYEAYRYPFRAHATKTLIAFNASPCKQGNLVLLQKLRALLFAGKDVHINMVTPFEEFKVKDAKVTKTVVGFDDKHVITFGDAKKKSAGSTELHKDLEYNDFCTDFLVKRGGAVFNADNFNAAKGPQRQQFSQLVAHTLADQILNTEQGMDCECQIRGFTRAKNVCKSVYTEDKTSK